MSNKKGVSGLVENTLKEMEGRRTSLVGKWGKFINAVNENLNSTQGRNLSTVEKHNLAQVLENALIEGGLRQKSRIFETTYQDNIAFLGIQLPVIAALLPSLELNKMAVVQTLDRRTGAVFYLDVRYGSNKGSISSGDDMMNAKTGHNSTVAGRQYARGLVTDELLGTGTGGQQTFTGTLEYHPLKVAVDSCGTAQAGNVTVSADTGLSSPETLTDDGAGVLSGDSGASGTINYTTGAISVTFAGTPVASAQVLVTYTYDMAKATDGVSQVDINLTSSTLTAEDFKLRANYELGAAIDLEKAHGLNLEDEIIKYLSGEIKFELDHLGIDLISEAASGAGAATAIGNFNVNPGSGQEFFFKKTEFLYYIERGSNNIFAKTQRAIANFVLCGNNVAALIKQLTGVGFVPAAGLDTINPTGPIEIGKLNGKPVIQDPFLNTNRYVLGYKGQSYLMAGFIYAPYIPLFSTPTLITADMKAQKGFYSAAGYKVINPGMFTYGTVTALTAS